MRDVAYIKYWGVRLLICCAITFVFTYPFHIFFQIVPVSELRPAAALPPVFGLLFGPWGALGAALGNLGSDIAIGYSPEICIIGFFAQFLYGYIPYKLWYTLGNQEENAPPRLNNLNRLIKFIAIVVVNGVFMAGLLGFLLEWVGMSNLVSFTTLLFAINNIDFSMMLGTLIIIGASIYGISMYTPQKTGKAGISPRIFDGMLATAVVIGVVYGVYSVFVGNDVWGVVVGVIFYLLVAAYVFKPITREIIEKTGTTKISLTERLIVIFIAIGAVIAVITVVVSFLTVRGVQIQFWELVYLNFSLVLWIFYISAIGFLWYIEKNITTPIESISDIARNYVGDSDVITSSDRIISQFENYAPMESEVGVLSRSFQKMVRDLEVYMKNLKKVTAEGERINTELNIARKIQQDMLPCKFPPFPNRKEFDIYAMNVPAKEVGGDFYDFFLIDEDHLGLIIADVSGKGVPAALFMVVAKTLIKDHAQLGKSPEEVFTTVNNQLYEGNNESMFVTAWMGILEISTGKFTYINAGHNLPLIKHAGEDYDWLKSESGFVLGGMENMEYHQSEITLKDGDRVYLYTDGVTEAVSADNELFGDSRLLKTINNQKNLDITEILSDIKKQIDSFVGDVEQSDDITMLILEYEIPFQEMDFSKELN